MADVPVRASLWDPELLETRLVCPLSGKRVSDACPDAVARSFVRGSVTAERDAEGPCELHRHASRAPAPSGWRCDPRGTATVVVLPEEFDDWLAAQPPGAPGRDSRGLPWLPRSSVPSCAAGPPERGALRVVEPRDGSVLLLSRAHGASAEQPVTLRAAVDHAAAAAVGQVEFIVDGALAGRAVEPFVVSVPLGRGDHQVTVRPTDPSMAVTVAVSRFSVR